MSWLGTPQVSVFFIRACYVVSYLLIALIVARVELHSSKNRRARTMHNNTCEDIPVEMIGLLWPISIFIMFIFWCGHLFHKAVRFEFGQDKQK